MHICQCSELQPVFLKLFMNCPSLRELELEYSRELRYSFGPVSPSHERTEKNASWPPLEKLKLSGCLNGGIWLGHDA